MKTIVMDPLPQCDICGKCEAAYDAPSRQGPWSYMCSRCYVFHAWPGIGTHLVKESQDDNRIADNNHHYTDVLFED